MSAVLMVCLGQEQPSLSTGSPFGLNTGSCPAFPAPPAFPRVPGIGIARTGRGHCLALRCFSLSALLCLLLVALKTRDSWAQICL